MLKGTIEINRLRVYGFIGVGEQERKVGNLFEVTVRLRYPIEEAMETDDPALTLSYVDIVDVVNEVFRQQVMLLERVAALVMQGLVERHPAITGGFIKIAKLTPPIPGSMESAAVTVEW